MKLWKRREPDEHLPREAVQLRNTIALKGTLILLGLSQIVVGAFIVHAAAGFLALGAVILWIAKTT